MKISAIASVAAIPFLSLALAGPANAAPPDINGTWSGQAFQVGRDKAFLVTMSVSAKGAEIQYPESACSGTLTRTGTGGDYVFFVEKITKGAFDPVKKTGCVEGSVTVQKTGAALTWGWIGSYEGQPIVVYGTLTKVAPPPAAPVAATTAAKPKATTAPAPAKKL